MKKLDSISVKQQIEVIRKRRKASAKASIKDKALQVIEDMCCNDDFSISESPYAKLLTRIYTYAHVANGTCQALHKDWIKELNDHYKAINQS